ncbi:MAG: ABC transporter transmembrane domain-containing protein, partial [Planctomycetota bacterium]
MKNLGRALRMALKYRWSLVLSMFCSLMVAIFWGANLGAVYPFIEVVLHDKSLHDWADENIVETKNEIASREQKIAELPADDLTTKSRLNSEINSLEKKLWLSEEIAPWIKAYAPSDPFSTLKLIVLFMLFGTLARCIFLASNMYLVARIGHRTILDLQNQVFNNVLNMEMSEIGVKGTGDLINRIRGETNAIGNAINTLFGKTIRVQQKMADCLIGAAFVYWRLLLFSLIVCPAALLVMIGLARKTKKANKKALEESANLLNRLYQALTYLRMVKSFNILCRVHLVQVRRA